MLFSPTTISLRVEDVPRAVIFLLVFLRLFVLAYFLRFRFSQLVVRAFTIPFREVQRFMQRATTGATANEIRVKNAI